MFSCYINSAPTFHWIVSDLCDFYFSYGINSQKKLGIKISDIWSDARKWVETRTFQQPHTFIIFVFVYICEHIYVYQPVDASVGVQEASLFNPRITTVFSCAQQILTKWGCSPPHTTCFEFSFPSGTQRNQREQSFLLFYRYLREVEKYWYHIFSKRT